MIPTEQIIYDMLETSHIEYIFVVVSISILFQHGCFAGQRGGMSKAVALMMIYLVDDVTGLRWEFTLNS